MYNFNFPGSIQHIYHIVVISDNVQNIKRKNKDFVQNSEIMDLHVTLDTVRKWQLDRTREVIYIKNRPLNVEVEHTYLGIVFSTRLSHNYMYAQNDLPKKAIKQFIYIEFTKHSKYFFENLSQGIWCPN